MDSKSMAYLQDPVKASELLPHEVKAKELILKFTTPVKLKPTDALQITVAALPEEDSPCITKLDMLATVRFVSRTWSPGRNTIVVLDVRYNWALCAYSESGAQWVEFWGQDEHDVAVGVTQYTFSVVQQVSLRSSDAIRTSNIILCNSCNNKVSVSSYNLHRTDM